MPGPAFEPKWLIGIVLTIVGAMAIWGRWETRDLAQRFELKTLQAVSDAKAYTDRTMHLMVSAEEFNLAVSFRDEQIRDLEMLLNKTLERLAKQETLTAEYRDWVRQLGPRVNGAVNEASELKGAFGAIGHQVSAMALDLEEVKEKQDQVREELIPRVEGKVNAHINRPHNGMFMTPNAQ